MRSCRTGRITEVQGWSFSYSPRAGVSGVGVGGVGWWLTDADGCRGQPVELPDLLPDGDEGYEMVGGTTAGLVGFGFLPFGVLLFLLCDS
jgi:hypothetical protein